MSVLVCSTAIAKYHRLSGLNDRHLLSHGSGSWKVWDQGASTVGFWRELSFWLTDSCLLTGWLGLGVGVSWDWETDSKLSHWCLFLKDTNPIARAPLSRPPSHLIISWSLHSQTASYWGLGFQHMKGGKHKHSVHNNSELYLGHPECLTTLEKSQKVSKLRPYKSEP